MNRHRLDVLFLLPLFVISWNTVRFSPGSAETTWYDLAIAAFLLAFLFDRVRGRDSAIDRRAAAVAGFMLAFLAVYLAGFVNLDSREAAGFWTKGVIAWSLHALYLVCGIAHVVRRGGDLYGRAIRWLVAGFAATCAYGLVQLAVQVGAGVNLDRIVVGTLTLGQGRTTGINVFGQVAGSENIYRINSLTGDPNHLGVFLCIPLLLLLPRYLADPGGGHRLGLLLAFLFAVQALTLSRSALLGDVVGLAVLFPMIRPILPPARAIGLALAALAAAFAALYAASGFVQTVVRARTQTSGRGTDIHLEFYQLVPQALDPHPLLGLGFNTYAVFYEFVTGKSDYSPHSFWIATLVETGLLGLGLYLVWFAYLAASALAMRRSGDADAARLGAGWTAALAGTAAANFFYLTMQYALFFVVAMLVVSGAALYARERVVARAPAGTLAR